MNKNINGWLVLFCTASSLTFAGTEHDTNAYIMRWTKKSAKIAFWGFMAAGVAMTGNNIRNTAPEVYVQGLPYDALSENTRFCTYHYSLRQDDNYLVPAARVDQLCTPPADPAVTDLCYITEICKTEGKPGWKENVMAFWGMIGTAAAGWWLL